MAIRIGRARGALLFLGIGYAFSGEPRFPIQDVIQSWTGSRPAENRGGTPDSTGRIRSPDFARERYRDSLRQGIKALPSCGKRDSLIIRLLGLHFKSDWGPPVRVRHGRVDSLEYEAKGEVPSEIGGLIELKRLMIHGVCPETLPPRLGDLRNLEGLTLNCKLGELPREMSNLRNLRSLDLGWNRFTSIPAVIFGFRQLRELKIKWNQLADIDSIGKLDGLEVLDAQHNRIRAVPVSIGRLRRLSELKLDWNPLQVLPVEIMDLKQLDTLGLWGTRLEERNLDSAIVPWLNRKAAGWRRQVSQKELRGFLQSMGNAFLPKQALWHRAILRSADAPPETTDIMELDGKKLGRILQGADSLGLSGFIRAQSGQDTEAIAPGEIIQGLLSAYAICERLPRVLGVLRQDVVSRRTSERILEDYNDWYDPVDMNLMMAEYLGKLTEINPALGRYMTRREAYFRFWGERKRDKTIGTMAGILDKLHRYCFPSMVPDSVLPSDNPPERAAGPVYFTPGYFQDRDAEDLDHHSGFPWREEIVQLYFEEVFLADKLGKDGEPKKLVVKDSSLWDKLLSLHSPYFDANLAYFGLIETAKNRFAWEEIGIKPKLSFHWKGIESDGPYTLYVKLEFPDLDKRQIKCIVGLPRGEVAHPHARPEGYAPAGLLSEQKRHPSEYDASYEVVRKYTVPPKSMDAALLLMVDEMFHPINPSSNYGKIRNRPRLAEEGHARSRSSLYAISGSGDTTLLCRHTQISVYGDGDLIYFEPYIAIPVFSDLDGDGRQELIVETSNGTTFFTQAAGGPLEKR